MQLLFSSLALAAFASKTVADKDTQYYRPGSSNPNVDQKMYWRSAINILQDMDQFDKLYIQFHSCAYVKKPCPWNSLE
jgi:hypothetical protein